MSIPIVFKASGFEVALRVRRPDHDSKRGGPWTFYRPPRQFDKRYVGTALIDRHPDTRFIIDHLGILQPRTPPAPPQPWRDLPKVLDLAQRENAFLQSAA